MSATLLNVQDYLLNLYAVLFKYIILYSCCHIDDDPDVDVMTGQHQKVISLPANYPLYCIRVDVDTLNMAAHLSKAVHVSNGRSFELVSGPANRHEESHRTQ